MSDAPATILLIEDDVRLAELTAQYFRQNDFRMETESRGDQALARFAAVQPDLVLLDLMLPGMDGLAICRALRAQSSVPILIFTAKDSDLDQVIGLEAGADDYVTKPVDPIILLARTRALLRRTRGSSALPDTTDEVLLGGLRISPSAHTVWLNGSVIDLTTQEFDLLLLLARDAGNVLSRQDLFQAMRGIEYDGLDRSIDGRISKLRKKLGDVAETPKRIKTIWGKGYLLVPDAWEPHA